MRVMCKTLNGKQQELYDLHHDRNMSDGYNYGYRCGVNDSFDVFKSAVELYKKYRNNEKQFRKDFADIHMGFKEFQEKHKNKQLSYFRYYREWLFDYCFKDVIKEEK